MTQIFDSLGWALLHSLWQGTLAMIAVIIFRGMTKNSAPSLRYNFQILCLFGCFAAFLITFGLYQLGGEAPLAVKSIMTVETVSNATALFMTASDSLKVSSQNLSVSAAASAPILGLLWCFGFVFMATRYFAAYILTQKLRHTGLTNAPIAWQHRFRTLALNTGVSENVRLFISSHVTGPLTIGFIKPVVLVPAGFLMGLPQDQVEAILLHELGHIRRYDYLVNLFQTAIKTVLFFHPAIHFISGKIDIDREQACDDLAVAQSKNPKALVLGLAALRVGIPVHGFALAADGKDTPLMDRLKRLVGSTEYQRRPEHLLMPLVATLMMSGIYFSTTSMASAHPEPKPYEHAKAKKQNYKFETKRLNGRNVTVKTTQDGRRWVLVDGAWVDVDKSPEVLNRLPMEMPQPPEPPKAPKYYNGSMNSQALEAKMDQFEIDMEYFEADLERYFEENNKLSEREQERIERQVERQAELAEREMERIEERIEAEVEREEERRNRSIDQAERRQERAERQQEREERQIERAVEQKERAKLQKLRAKKQKQRAQEQKQRAQEQKHKSNKTHAKYDHLRETLYAYLISDGFISSPLEKATMRYTDNNWTVNGQVISSELEGKYCNAMENGGVRKASLTKVSIKPESIHVVSASGSGKKSHTHEVTVGKHVHRDGKTYNHQSATPSLGYFEPAPNPQPIIQSMNFDVSVSEPAFVWPTNSRYITAKFGQIGKLWDTTHHGIDLKGATGEPVFASADGVVQLVTTEVKWGNRIILKHTNGYQSLYGHLNSLEVSRGQRVKAGDIIGSVGSTGKSTGPHLHFEIRKNGRHVNPAPLI